MKIPAKPTVAEVLARIAKPRDPRGVRGVLQPSSVNVDRANIAKPVATTQRSTA
jgi:hypothetical protein